MNQNLQEMINIHGHGFCNILALYAAKIKKLKCCAIIKYSSEEEDGIEEGLPILIHAFTKINDDLGFDAYGIRSIEKIYLDYGEPDDYTYHLIEDAYNFLENHSTIDCFGTLSSHKIQLWTIPLIRHYFLI